MFKKWGHSDSDEPSQEKDNLPQDQAVPETPVRSIQRDKTSNTLLKGSKLSGDINVSCDLELSGEIEGNITSILDSNIVIKGACRGNISTKEGSVRIEGELTGGNITAGSDIVITGKYEGGEIKAGNRITINGEFNGKIEASDVEIGPEAHGSAEIFYKESISVSKGVNIEGQICKLPAELTLIKSTPDSEEKTEEPPLKEANES